MSNRKQFYLYVGDDDFPMEAAARDLVGRLVPPAQQAFGLEVVEGRADSVDDALTAIKRCREALVTPGFMMSGGKVIWWRSVTFTDDAVLTANESVKAAMKDLASVLEEGHAGDSVLVITARGMDKRSAFYKLAASRFEVREFMLPEKAYQLEQHGRGVIARVLKEKGIMADPATVELLLERVGSDSRQIAMELEKLALYLGERRQATAQDVQAVVSRSLTSVTWDLQDALGERRLADALEILRDLLANREAPIRIMMAVMTRMRDLLSYRECLDQGWLRIRGAGRNEQADWGALPEGVEAGLVSAFKRDPRSMHPFVVVKMAQQARGYSMEALRRNQRLLMDVYEDLVSSRIPEATTLELMLIRVMT
jgi:DNA polymerase-3 subunit delta